MGKDNIWDKIKGGVSKFAPVLGNALVPGVGGIAGTLIAEALDVDNEPENIQNALENITPEMEYRLKDVQSQNVLELRKLALQVEIARQAAEAKKISEINQTMRGEIKSEDPWTRRWRPFWGYISGAAFFMICAAITYSIMAGQGMALKELGNIVIAIATLFSIPGAILGVTAWHRGVKQRVESGEVVTGKSMIASAIAKKIGG